MKRIVLLGKSGQLGWELQRSLAPLADLVALDHRGFPASNADTPEWALGGDLCGDLARIEALETTLRRLRPDVVVNAAAYTAVDRAEAEPEIAAAINAVAPGALARTCADLNACLVHFSSDYVFDGRGCRAWNEEDPTAPLNVYGRSKLKGEERVRESGCRHLILRTSWLYSTRRENFPKTILRLACERDELKVVNDQFGAPTGADLIADVTAHALCAITRNPDLAGTYHAAAAGETNWFDYARFVVERARDRGWPVRVGSARITPVPSSARPGSASRPMNSLLSCRKLELAFGLRMPLWKDGVERLVMELSPLAHRDADCLLEALSEPSVVVTPRMRTNRPT